MIQFEDLLYARGFLVAPTSVDLSFDRLGWTLCRVGSGANSYNVWYDMRNTGCYVSDSRNYVFVLGLLLDPEKDSDSHREIAEELLMRVQDKEAFWQYVEILCGRFIIIYGTGDDSYITQDATGMRTCYFGDKLVASHYGLINQFEHHEEMPFMRKYRRIVTRRPDYLPGDQTPYLRILTLLPNHELCLRTHKMKRIFPRGPLELMSANEVGDYFAKLIQREANLLARRSRPVLSFTGGNDSRVTLSAFKAVKEKIELFTYDNHSSYDPARGYTCSYDIRMAQAIADDFGLSLSILDLQPCDPRLVAQIRKTHYHHHIDSAIPAYLSAFASGRELHVRSNILETIRSRTYFRIKNNSATAMADMIYGGAGYGADDEVVNAYEAYFKRQEWDAIYDYDPSDLFYWEMRMGVWHAGGILLASDMAFDTYCLFNQRKLLRLGMAMPALFRKSNFLVEYVIEKLWPELYFRIPNTDETLLQSRSPFDSYFSRWIHNVQVTSNLGDYYHRTSNNQVEVGFVRNERRVGDCITINIEVICAQPIVRFSCLLTGVSHWEGRDLTGLVCNLKINGSLIKAVTCDALRQKPELIDEKVSGNGRTKVEIELCSQANVSKSENIFVLRASSFAGYFPSK